MPSAAPGAPAPLYPRCQDQWDLSSLTVTVAAAVAAYALGGDRRGAWRSLRPHLSVPLSARRSLLRTGSGVIAVRAPGGFYCSPGPSLALAVAPYAAAAGGLLFFT
ncbi:hypothetical protein ACFVY4_21320 [Streptomyces sp. NPDC058299]|uniref:hypothetical protein n=1 Tax=Streptomyces sp. NPDC058299 TaxID=3346435 RepID=UPI0036E897BC